MSSTGPSQEPYNYQRPYATSTRAMIGQTDSPNAPHIGPEYHTPASHPPHSHAPTSKNYEKALSDRAVSTTSDTSSAPPKVVAGLAYRGDNADATTPGRPGVLGRQQSWKASDQKRANMERMLSSGNTNTLGYSTAGKQ